MSDSRVVTCATCHEDQTITEPGPEGWELREGTNPETNARERVWVVVWKCPHPCETPNEVVVETDPNPEPEIPNA